ncbi:relaxase/mobilization nuclease domain-containing protein [Chitinophaga barathri]|uniref:MobA/VirD2-like nuclease domain-containing protein n=1 Tax=Chitinophaga barathri TaxID=1647451 RepID=A0A3N4MVN5_9BACT|nr:relaxase/mobilization nuclease domain-containing protein [Chitinophaga barathri]RPD39453.1 hypothetical protein EG028_20245 [Chitinophaga barathri]
MISKVITGKSFSGCCRYVCKPAERAEILYVHGVRESDPKQMAEDFEQSRRLLPNKHRAVFHGILSFHPDDKVTNELMANLAQKYLQEIGLINTQVAVVKHTDKAHPHLHIIANLVNLNGKAISDSWLGLRGKKAAQALTQAHRLIVAERRPRKQPGRVLSEEETVKEEIHTAIATGRMLCHSFEELQNWMVRHQIDVMFKRNRAGEICGISFRKGKYAFKGSSIHRAYSFSGFQKTFGYRPNIRIEQAPRLRRGLRR